MDGSNADSDHSMTWEDFFGSTTDLTPTLLGIYDSLLEPAKSLRPEVTAVETAKDARNDPPVSDNAATTVMTEETIDNTGSQPRKDPTKIAGSVKLPIATANKSSLYSARTKSDNNGASEIKSEFTTSETTDYVSDAKVDRTIKELKQSEPASFGNLSPNVKRMISSASETTTLKFQKKSLTATKSYTRQRSNIPLVGATSKISQSGVDLLTSVEIYDKPSALKSFRKTREVSKSPIKAEPEPKLEDVQTTYDVPVSNRPAIYDIPNVNNKTAFESLSLPYIDQSIELSITSNDREFDIQINSKENSPQQHEPISSPDVSPAKFPKTLNGGTNSLHRKDFIAKSDSPSKLSKIGSYPEAVGSTGNLKACVIPEKEVVRLNPAVEVSRPQSMSSITSSSSTSSSGVQNKGGVNSAYLASIESLDDHSDADMTSAIGSNNFVNNAGTRTSEDRKPGSIAGDHTEEMAGLSQLERVCAEIVQTENIYVEDLRQVVEGYLHVWRRESTFSDEELVELFNNIEDIYSFNRSLCEELNTCGLDATCMARCFVNNTAGFSVYTSYCTGYPRTMERLATLALNPDSALEFRERQSALGHPLPLASYLLKPVQRILKYHLLLQNVVKQCKTDETEYALHKMTGIAQHIDDMKRRHEHAVRVQEIQSLLYGWNGPDLTTYGELCAEGTFRVFGAKAMRHAFLFDNMLLITKNREDGILAYKSHIMCNNMMLVESIAGAPLSFHVIPWDAPRAQLTLQARSHTHKREWTLLLKRVILENYNAVIPSHARQLVMELGQNKTDDDILAEKSHNLITQASMRKQLSAPEYLEKRKLERERRKSFENGIRGRLKKVSRKTTAPTRSDLSQECDCVQISAEKGIDYTCDSCYIDLCSDCESKLNKNKPKDEKCICKNEDHEINGDKCPECDRSLQYIDACSTERLDRKQSGCNCSDFVSSQESFNKDYGSSLNKTRGYHSSDNIVGYTENGKSKDDLSDINDSMTNIRNIPKTCLKCSKIKENVVVTDISSTLSRKSRCNDNLKHRADTFRSKSRDDPHRSKLSKIGTWRRKSEPGLQNNNIRKTHDSDSENTRGSERIEFECRNCGSNKISKKSKTLDSAIGSENELDAKAKSNLEVRMYTTKNIPKKISKLKKNRAKGLLLGSDKTAKFYTDFSTDVSTENILHISESNDSLNVEKVNLPSLDIPATISKDDNIDEETYKKLIEKTDSFKKNELEKVKHLNKQKVINEGSETEDKICENEDVQESCEETEQPLEQIISQLLMQNRELQKVLKKQQLRNTAQRRHQRLLKSHSNPEHVIVARNFDATKMKPKFGRQTSEVIDIQDQPEQKDLKENDEIKIDKTSEEDHIYETLRVEPRVNENLHSINSKSKLIQHNSHISRPKRIPSPPSTLVKSEINKFDSDYVYLSFDQLNNINDDSIYDVPVKSPQKIDTQSNEYHVPIDIVGSPKDKEDVYDNLIDVCRRKKDVPNHLPTTNYNPMNTDDQSPNTPEIWLSRQKEHFNVSRDRKSGSLPRSFQVITSNQEDNLSSFKCTPNSNSKTFLNREGKVLSIDRPFTIASDQSELSYDDLENYMNDGERLKFAKTITKDSKDVPDFSQSTLELEEEIDRCYRNNFDKIDLDANKNENLLNIAQTNLNTSTASSFEILPTDRNEEIMKETEVIHPEHKIYKPTSNMLSLKNVLNRFKNKTPNKSIEEQEVNANEQSTPDSVKSEVKSPSNEKRSALNPRSYSKNLLQRFKSIISDEHTDDNENKESDTKHRKSIDTSPKLLKSDIKVVITSSDVTPTISTIYSISNDPLSKSVCDNTTLSESQNEKNNLEELSHSCDNITEKSYSFRPSYEKSVSLITNISAVSSPSKSNNSSFQSLNKLPIYMQGSKHLGARIAQSDYADPSTLATEKTALKNINVLINKSAVRPDSLFSNSSFVTSSSEGCQENQIKTAITTNTISEEEKTTNETKSDESFYEKTFEKIEHITGEDVFRDSAVYSDQDETEDVKMQSTTKDGHGINKVVTRVESINRNQAQKITITKSITETKSSLTKVNKIQSRSQPAEEKVRNKIESKVVNSEKISKSKNAPPVPIKPKISSIPSSTFYTRSAINNKLSSIKVDEKIEGTIAKSFKRSISSKPLSRSEILGKNELNETNPIDAKTESKEKNTVETENLNKSYQGNIQIKRLSFERASLDSATRKSKATNEDTSDKQFKTEPSSVTSKSVMERRMEIELMSKSQTSKTSNIKKPGQIIRPKSITMKVATFERSMSDRGDNSKRDTNTSSTSSSEKPNIPTVKTSISEQIKTESEDVDAKGSWVKQVVNKFQ